ncbi:polysaccharide biosynthesis/export family protein [Arsenicitalea aurantiaca]|nr:polysaccharide biosynthesis/export family protein [Arsenicitalea aurantiaca]
MSGQSAGELSYGGIAMRWLRMLGLVITLSALAGCAMNTRPATYLVETSGPYRLDTGDTVRVTVYDDEALNAEYRIDDAGAIAFPLVGAIPVRGVTTETASRRIAAALANGFLRNPNVAVEVAEYRPFFIQGAVGTSGQFAYVYGMTVRAAISVAGGFSDTADRSQALLYRRQGSEMAKGSVDLDFPLQPGDTVVVLERWL